MKTVDFNFGSKVYYDPDQDAIFLVTQTPTLNYMYIAFEFAQLDGFHPEHYGFIYIGEF